MGGSCDYGDEPFLAYFEQEIEELPDGLSIECDDCEAKGEADQRGWYIECGLDSDGWAHWALCPKCYPTYKYLWRQGAECLATGQLDSWLDNDSLSPHDFMPGGEYEDCPDAEKIAAGLLEAFGPGDADGR